MSALVAALLLVPAARARRPSARCRSRRPAASRWPARCWCRTGAGPFPAAVLVSGFGPPGPRRRGPAAAYRAIAQGLARRRAWWCCGTTSAASGARTAPALSWLDARPLAADAAAAVRLLAAIPGHRHPPRDAGGPQPGRRPGVRGGAAVAGHARREPLGARPAPGAAAARGGRREPLPAPPGGPGGRRRDPPPRTRCATPPRAPPAGAAGAGHARPHRAVLGHGPPRRAPAAPRGTSRRTLPVPGAGHFLQVEGRVPLRALDAIAAFAA